MGEERVYPAPYASLPVAVTAVAPWRDPYP
jgi:hypothetical protein